MKQFNQFIKGLEESLAYLEETKREPSKLSGSAAALDRSLQQIEADLIEEDKFSFAAKGHNRVEMPSEPPSKIKKGTLYLTIGKDKKTITAQSSHIKPPKNLSEAESKGLQQLLKYKDFDSLPAPITDLALIGKLIPICDYSLAQKIENFKNGLKKILKFIIDNKGIYSKILSGETQRIEKADSGCGHTFFLSRNGNDEMELHINEKTKLGKYRREGKDKIVKKTFVFKNNEWERHAGLVIKEIFYQKNIFFQDGKLSPAIENEIISKDQITVIRGGSQFFLGFLNKSGEYEEILLEKEKNKKLISSLHEIIQKKRITNKKIINSSHVRAEIFSIIGYKSQNYILSESGEEIEKEIRLANRTKSPHVATPKLLCHYEDKRTGKLKLAADAELAFCDLEELSEKHRDQVNLTDVYSIIYTAFKGLADTHAAKIIHQDIKTKNILIKKDKEGNFRALIADFGSAIIERKKYSEITSATPGYAAPEFWEALLTEGPRSSEKSPIGNLFDQFSEFKDRQEEANIALNKFRDEQIPFISDSKPNKSNDVWALALSIKNFLTAFKTSVNYSSLDELNKENIELLIKSMNDILYSPRETRTNAADFLSEKLPEIISTLATKETVEINKRLDVLKAMKYSGGGTAEIKPEILHKKPEPPVSPRLVPTLITQLQPVTAHTAPLPQPDTKKTESLPSTQDKPEPPAQIKPLEESFNDLEEYKKLIVREINGEDGKGKRNYDNRFAFFNPGCNKQQKSIKVDLVIQALTAAQENKEYSKVRNIIAENSRIFGVFRNGRLSGYINQLKMALALDPKVKPSNFF